MSAPTSGRLTLSRPLDDITTERLVQAGARRLAMNNWRSNADMVRFYAASLTDAELLWFTEIDKATRNKAIARHPDDALRLSDLRAALSQRRSEQRSQQLQEGWRETDERLKRLAAIADPQPGKAGPQ